MDGNSSDVMNIDDIAEYLKLPKPTVYKLAQGGRTLWQEGWAAVAFSQVCY